MPWKETTTMEQKVEFICEWLCEKYTITELCKLSPLTNSVRNKLQVN